jgi:hypothetical protein
VVGRSGCDLAPFEEGNGLLVELFFGPSVPAAYEALIPAVRDCVHHQRLHLAARLEVTVVQHPGKNPVTICDVRADASEDSDQSPHPPIVAGIGAGICTHLY